MIGSSGNRINWAGISNLRWQSKGNIRLSAFPCNGLSLGSEPRRARNHSTFTVRKISFGHGVERIFPLHSPVVDKIEVVRTTRVRRAKLYYLRKLRGKAARLRAAQAEQEA